MKIAIAVTSSGNDAHVDTHGARAPYYLILKTDSGSSEILPNPVTQTERRAGPQAAAFLISQGVDKVVAGDFGPKFRAELEGSNINCTEMAGSVVEVVAELREQIQEPL
jgi:predicted Fe-Mo cluster-binding NifX family protein